jgi:hypothetical protein
MEGLRQLVRPTVTWAFALTVCAGFFLGKISADQLLGLAGIAIGAWYGSRQGSQKE